MKVIGIICEYNPFHNGHIYHIKKIKEIYKDCIIVLAISSYFTQRGEISLLSKRDKTILALNYGVDLVIEMPTIYTINSADTFALLGVSLLNNLKVDAIVFGSELNDVNYLLDVSKKFNDQNIIDMVKKHLKEGTNYPTSLAKALNVNLSSNDLLGVSYIKAINKINPLIKPVTIKRTNDYNDLDSTNEIISGKNIREKLKQNENISKYIPDYFGIKLKKVNYKKLFSTLKIKILTEPDLTRFLGVDEGIESRLKKCALTSKSYDELIKNVKTKRYTYLRIQRMFMNILLGILKTDKFKELPYFRVIGFNRTGKDYLKSIKPENLSFKNEGRIYEVEINSSIIYDFLTNSNTFDKEILNKPEIF